MVRSRLLSAEEVETFRADADATAEDLARALVRAGKLTKYQVKELFSNQDVARKDGLLKKASRSRLPDGT